MWRTMLADWANEQAPTAEKKDAAWDSFRQKYSSDDAFIPVVDYIRTEWMEDTVAFLNCETNTYLHFDNRATSRNESAHSALDSQTRSTSFDSRSSLYNSFF
jgi:hypothetical protein